MSYLILASSGLIVGWFLGFRSRRVRARNRLATLQREIDGLEELIALERMRARPVPVSPGASKHQWVSALPDQPPSRAARPRRPATESVSESA
jgi:hypothetical protein